MYQKKTTWLDYATQNKRYSLNADPTTDRIIQQTQRALEEEIGQKVSYSYAVAYLLKRGFRTQGLHQTAS
ncbi:hypothetical protein [Rheinheimera texasensis]|uniref:hypothetical protein n=1 Tax=Rheinheimera texasensis TaxID=306205 RepID=UPI0032B1D056